MGTRGGILWASGTWQGKRVGVKCKIEGGAHWVKGVGFVLWGGEVGDLMATGNQKREIFVVERDWDTRKGNRGHLLTLKKRRKKGGTETSVIHVSKTGHLPGIEVGFTKKGRKRPESCFQMGRVECCWFFRFVVIHGRNIM